MTSLIPTAGADGSAKCSSSVSPGERGVLLEDFSDIQSLPEFTSAMDAPPTSLRALAAAEARFFQGLRNLGNGRPDAGSEVTGAGPRPGPSGGNTAKTGSIRRNPPAGTDPGWVARIIESTQEGGSLFSRISAKHVAENSRPTPRWLALATGVQASNELQAAGALA